MDATRPDIAVKTGRRGPFITGFTDVAGLRVKEAGMLYWAVVFLIVAIVAGVLGFGGIAGAATSIAQILFFIFIVIFIVALLSGWRGRRPPAG